MFLSQYMPLARGKTPTIRYDTAFVHMFVMGAGVGMVMQNLVPNRALGTAAVALEDTETADRSR